MSSTNWLNGLIQRVSVSRRLVADRISDLVTGYLMPTRGGCVCDPVAFERDTRARLEEYANESPTASTTMSVPDAPANSGVPS